REVCGLPPSTIRFADRRDRARTVAVDDPARPEMLARQPTTRVLLFGGPLVMAALLAMALSSHLGVHTLSSPPWSPRISANQTPGAPPLRLVPGGLLLTPPEVPPASVDVALTPPWPPELTLVSSDTHSPGKIPGRSPAAPNNPPSAPVSGPEIDGLRKAPAL